MFIISLTVAATLFTFLMSVSNRVDDTRDSVKDSLSSIYARLTALESNLNAERIETLERKAANWTYTCSSETVDKYIEAYFQRLRMTQ